jgi:hypothetical protein
MMNILAFPFTFESSGRAATIEQNSDFHAAQQISQFVQTRIGELPLAPTYGIEDPEFRGIDPSEVLVGTALFHPGVQIIDINSKYQDDGIQSLVVTFNTLSASISGNVFAATDGQVSIGA